MVVVRQVGRDKKGLAVHLPCTMWPRTIPTLKKIPSFATTGDSIVQEMGLAYLRLKRKTSMWARNWLTVLQQDYLITVVMP
jgi:hypothetical protein